MSASAQPTSQDLKNALSKYSYQASCGHQASCKRVYVDFEKFCKDYFTADCIKKHVDAIFPLESHPQRPVDLNRLSTNWRKTFVILLSINHGQSIKHFVKNYELSDSRLPFSQDTLKRAFRNTPDEPNKYAQDFFQGQWKFLTRPLVFDQLQPCKADHILPFHDWGKINDKSWHATLWRVTVREAFVEEALREKVAHSSVKLKDSDGTTMPGYTFAIKRFLHKREVAFNQEVEAFKHLRDHEGMIKYLGDWEHETPLDCLSEKEQKGLSPEEKSKGKIITHNILLEYGQQDLDIYFSSLDTPILQQETSNFWGELHSVIRTIQEIHCWQPKDNPNLFQGLHADIKPDNLLWIFESDGKARLRLADPGLFNFSRASSNLEQTRITVNGGTRTYSPPECSSLSEHQSRTQSLDIWSLGCVMSIAATWVVGGSSFVKAYERLREHANLSHPTNDLPEKHDQFHNGKDVLPEVGEWHHFIKSYIRVEDHLTGKIVDLIDRSMLRGPVEQRHTAAQLVKEMSHIISDASQNEVPVSSLIRDCLLEVDEKAETKATASGSLGFRPANGVVYSPQERKAIRNQSVKKVACRTQSLLAQQYGGSASFTGRLQQKSASAKSTMQHQQEIAEQATVGARRASKPHLDLNNNLAPISEQPESVNAHNNGLPSHTTTLTSPDRVGPPDPPPKFERLEEAMMKNKEVRKNPSKENMKDSYLEYYLGNRDIVFVVDNSSTMEEHWHRACLVLNALAWKARGLDTDGMDLYFTRTGSNDPELSRRKVEFKSWNKLPLVRMKEETPFFKAMQQRHVRPKHDGGTDMQKCLGRFFAEYQQELREHAKRNTSPKYKTLIVLTDGIWSEMVSRHRVRDLIAKFVKALSKEQVVDYATRPFSIQFVQFGDDPEATRRLKDLDDKWPAGDQNWDIVDTEPDTGNIYKMILGSLVPHLDMQDSQASQRMSQRLSGVQL